MDRKSYRRVREVCVACMVCVFLGLAESLPQIHYGRDIMWQRAAGIVASKGNTIAIPRPQEPPILHFLPAFKAAARLAFPILGIRVNAE